MTSPSLTLAPALMVRVAAWPLSVLDGLGDGELGELAARLSTPKPGRRDRAAHHARRTDEEAYAARYAATLEAERAQLWTRTGADPRFVHALWLSNPQLGARVAELASEVPGTSKRHRHLQTTLLRYLVRAASRATPCDAWSGVVLAELGERTQVAATEARIVLAPDLRPFQAILRALAVRPHHRARARYAASPTLRRTESGWQCWARMPSGHAEPRVLDTHAIADLLLLEASRPGRPARGRELSTRVAAQLPPALQPHVDEVLAALIGHGFLVGGLDLPARFTSPWRALHVAARRLEAHERQLWLEALTALQQLAEHLTPTPTLAEPTSAVHARMADASQRAVEIVATLARALDVTVDVPRALFRADRVGGWHITLGPELRASLTRTVQEYEHLQAELGLGLAFRASARAHSAARLAEGVSLDQLVPDDANFPVQLADATWEALAAAIPGGHALAPVLARWTALVEGTARERTWTPEGHAPPVSPPPLGALMLVPHRDRAWVQGVIDEHTVVHARFAWALGRDTDPLGRWLSERLRGLARDAGVAVYDYATYAERQPNVTARPLYVPRALEPWGAGGDRRALRGLSVSLDPHSDAPRARAPSLTRPFVIAHFSASHTLGDPIARVVLPTTFRDAPLHAVQASTVPFEVERGRTTPTPALLLPDGSLARAPRWHLAGPTLEALLASSGAERFRAWQGLARAAELPARVLVRLDHEPPVLLLRDSPLALEALLEGARGQVHRLIFELPPTSEPWLRDEHGHAFVSEWAIPFERHAHAWSTRIAP